MLDFKDLNVKAPERNFTGTKIPMRKVIYKQIIVHDFKIEPSRYPEKSADGNRLCLQFKMDDKMHIVFSGSGVLMETVKLIDKTKLPVRTTIKEEFGRLQFT